MERPKVLLTLKAFAIIGIKGGVAATTHTTTITKTTSLPLAHPSPLP